MIGCEEEEIRYLLFFLIVEERLKMFDGFLELPTLPHCFSLSANKVAPHRI